jgi:ATP synthase I chain
VPVTTPRNPAGAAAGGEAGTLTEKRMAWLTLALGVTAAAATGLSYRWSWAVGLLIGTVLAWLNLLWLARGLDALLDASTGQTRAAKPQVPVGTYFLALFRYALIALIVYVSFKVLNVPLVSMILGLCALGAAAVAASVYEVVRPANTGR